MEKWLRNRLIHPSDTELYGDGHGVAFSELARSVLQPQAYLGAMGVRREPDTSVLGRSDTKGHDGILGKGTGEGWWVSALPGLSPPCGWNLGHFWGSARTWGWERTLWRPRQLSAGERQPTPEVSVHLGKMARPVLRSPEDRAEAGRQSEAAGAHEEEPPRWEGGF